MSSLGEFEQLVLFAALRLDEDASGVAMHDEIEARTGRDVSPGAICTTLGRLEERGFVRSVVTTPASARVGRARKHYSLQPAGAKALQDGHRNMKGLVMIITGACSNMSRLLTLVACACMLLTAPGSVAAIAQSNNPATGGPLETVQMFLRAGSGKAGPRDFDRMRTLFAPNAVITTVRREADGSAKPYARGLEQYIAESRDWLAKNDQYEEVVRSWIDRYANFGHVLCVIEAKRSQSDPTPFYRAVGSFQLVFDGTRWWILSAFWQGEHPSESLPSKYLPGARDDGE